MRYNNVAQLINLVVSTGCGDYIGEFFIVSDLTESFNDIHKTLKNIDFVEFLQKFEESKIGIGSFSDKAISPMGTSEDICFKIDLPLSNDATRIEDKIKYLEELDGGDSQGSQLDAIYYSIRSDQISWSYRHHSKHGQKILKIVILITVADFHNNNVGQSKLEKLVDNENIDCLKFDYPSVSTISEILNDKNVYLLIITNTDMKIIYDDLLEALDMRGIVKTVASSFSDLESKMIAGIEDISCLVTSSKINEIKTDITTPPPLNDFRSLSIGLSVISLAFVGVFAVLVIYYTYDYFSTRPDPQLLEEQKSIIDIAVNEVYGIDEEQINE